MNINKAQVANRFNRSVSTYDQHASVQKQMAHQLMHHLQERRQPVKRICEIGCGTGYLTQFLTKLYPESELVAIDLAAQMIETAKTKVTSPNVHWIVGDAEELYRYISDPFDLIVSNATIQWLSSPQDTLGLWVEALRPDGWLVASTFGQDTFGELATTFQKVELDLGLEPSQHRLSMHSLHFWKQIWGEAGLTFIDGREDWLRARYSDCRTFLQSIKATGANYSETTRQQRINRHLLLRVMAEYDQIYQIDSQVYATYHLLYLYGRSRRKQKAPLK